MRDRHEELTEEQYRERVAEEGGHDQRFQRAEPVQMVERDVERHDRHLGREHEGREDEDPHGLAAPPVHARDRVRDRDARQHRPDGREGRVDHGVDRVANERDVGEDLREVRPTERVRPDLTRQALLPGHERGRQHDQERQHERDAHRDRERMVRDRVERAPPADVGGERGAQSHLGAHLKPPW